MLNHLTFHDLNVFASFVTAGTNKFSGSFLTLTFFQNYVDLLNRCFERANKRHTKICEKMKKKPGFEDIFDRNAATEESNYRVSFNSSDKVINLKLFFHFLSCLVRNILFNFIIENC